MARGVWRLACTLTGVLVLLSLCQVKILPQYKPDLTEENRYMGRSLLQDNVENIRVSCAMYIYIYILQRKPFCFPIWFCSCCQIESPKNCT